MGRRSERIVALFDVMKRFNISRLASLAGLSRSTLLYYDRIGLLPPSGRTGAGYRYYTEKDLKRLKRVCHFRGAGLSLDEIRQILKSGGKPGAKLLERRLDQMTDSMLDLRAKQRILAGMLRQVTRKNSGGPVDKQMWVEMLQAAGMDDEAMSRWHSEFERRSPEGHEEFLVSLGIPRQEIMAIRRWAGGVEGCLKK